MSIETRIREALNPDREPMASTCCHGQCLQGRSCPYREAVTPKDELPTPRRDVALELLTWVAAAVTVCALAVALGVVG